MQNLRKITQHGKRASSIGNGMLAHSRTAIGERLLTDLNGLSNEYLRLAFHGFRANNKNFQCELVTDFDSNLPIASVISQEISGVVLNLYNNAFCVVTQKQKRLQTPTSPPLRSARTTATRVPKSASEKTEPAFQPRRKARYSVFFLPPI